jgi:hypothetical protein
LSFDRGHALIIGAGAYQYVSHLDVPLAVADAQAVGAVLRDPRQCGYSPEQVTLLAGAHATRANILDSLDRLARRVEPQSTVVLFYSGHGHYGDDGAYYLMGHDTRLSASQKVLAGTAVSHQELLLKLQALRAERILLIFDACHAGVISPTLAGSEPFTGQSLPNQTSAALLATGTGRIILTSCREHQYSFVGNGALTIFGQALVDGLRGKGIRGQRGSISAFDLYAHLYDTVGEAVKRDVPEVVRQRYGAAQEPELTALQGVVAFAVALYAGTGQAEADLPEQPPAGPAVRLVGADESQAAFQQIQSGGTNVGQHNTFQIGGDVVGADKIDLSGSQGAMIRPSGSVNQRNINTGGGDYAEGNVDKRTGVFINGGTVSGPVVGVNSGTIITNTNIPRSGAAQPVSLEHVFDQVQYHVALARQNGDDDLAEDLDGVVSALRAALRALHDGKAARCRGKVDEARQMLQQVVTNRPALSGLVRLLDQLNL